MSTKKEKCRCCDGECNHDACCGKIEENCATNCPCHQSESIEWEEDSWCVSIVAEAMTFARTEPIGKDASHITRKLREKVSQAITTAVAKRDEFYQKNEERRLERYEALDWHKGKMAERKRIVEMIEKMVGFTDGVESHSFIDKDKILKIIKH